MSFRQLNTKGLAKFDSRSSCRLLETYEDAVNERMERENSRQPSKSFAASSFRCDRKSWFRLRGTPVDEISIGDKTLDHISRMGTAIHRDIQSDLRDYLGQDWIDVKKYLEEMDTDYTYSVKSDPSGLETLVSIDNPPIKFSCDGIIRLEGELYLLEIKTSEISSFRNLESVKPQHMDQIRCYASLLKLPDVLVMYVDRQYGDVKCYEVNFRSYELQEVRDRFYRVLQNVATGIAPEGLPSGDPWCTPSMCPYYKTCKEYGRF